MTKNRLLFKPFFSETKVAIDSAKEVGNTILRIYKKDFDVKTKEGDAPVTEADLKSQKIILNRVSVFGYPFLSEESKDNKERLNHNKIWVIDPLDGTSDFIQKTGEFSVMIALVENHKPTIGVVYQPTEDILFVAEKGKGAYKHEKGVWSKLSVNDISDLNKSKAILSRSHLSKEEKEFLTQLNLSQFKQKGSCGLKVADICEGHAELYFTTTNKIKQWDTAAAYVLITESGGKMTDMYGNEIMYNTNITNHEKGVLVTNGKIHSRIIEKYKKFKN